MSSNNGSNQNSNLIGTYITSVEVWYCKGSS